MSLPHPEDPRDTITIERLAEKDTAIWVRILNHSSPGLTDHLLHCTRCSPDFCEEAKQFLRQELLAA